MRRTLPLVALVLAGACVSKGDLRRIEEQVALSRAENQRADSARAAQLTQLLGMQQRIMDSMTAAQQRLVAAVQGTLQSTVGDLAEDLYHIQEQLVQIQALQGQSQQRLTELRTQLEARNEQLAQHPEGAAPAATPSGAPVDSAAPPARTQPSADQIYEASLQQLRRGSPSTARLGFRELLRLYPNDPRVPDATYFIGESFAAESPDSAAAYYGQVVQAFPQSPRAASALYKLGLLAERRRDAETARNFYQRVIKDYPRSDEAALARDRLKSLGR